VELDTQPRHVVSAFYDKGRVLYVATQQGRTAALGEVGLDPVAKSNFTFDSYLRGGL